MVRREDIKKAFSELGIQQGEIVLVHSSLRSLGEIENGAETVIRGIEDLIGSKGTLVMPTLCAVDFENSYKTWYMDKPSYVGYLTEYFRKQPYVYRSNQATHSVAARGELAYELTYEHTAYGPHRCPFGDYAFADSSPWKKMYDRDANIVFLGVDLSNNTMKHYAEIRFTEELLSQVKDKEKAEYLKSRLITFYWTPEDGVWPYYKGRKMETAMEEAGLVTQTTCGDAVLKKIRARESTDFAIQQLLNEPEKWCEGAMLDWVNDCKKQ